MSAHSKSTRRITLDDLEPICRAAVEAAGGSPETARALVSATMDAERRGKTEVGVSHLIDYLNAIREGRLNGDPHPRLSHSRSAVVTVDADAGTAQLAFDRAFDDLVERAQECGVAVLSVHDSFSAGELGHYTARLAEEGLVALACANSPALMSVFGAREPITGTNPLSFALPHPSGPRMFDQASSVVAWVRIRDAARNSERIPGDWALDDNGEPTEDAESALAGSLLPFGGAKGANIAMMVEMLAVLAGGTFALDAAPFDSGCASPRLGLFVVAIDPTAFDPAYPQRAESHLRRLASEHGADFGRRHSPVTEIEIGVDILGALGLPMSIASLPV